MRGELLFGRPEAQRCSCGPTAATETICRRAGLDKREESRKDFQDERAEREAGSPVRRRELRLVEVLLQQLSLQGLGYPVAENEKVGRRGQVLCEESSERIKTEK